MPSQGSISCFLDGLKAGDDAATGALWERYCARLVRLAAQKLRHMPRRAADEEDVALSAFHSLCQGAQKGRFPALGDRNALWGLLVFITAQKAADLITHERRKKRGGGKLRGHSVLEGNQPGSGPAGFDQFLARSPSPATLQVWAEEYQRLFDQLGNETLRQVAEMRVQGYEIDEIAQKLGCARRTVHRKLKLIRKIWLAERPACQ